MNRDQHYSQAGFGLIELVIVIAVIAILAAIAVPRYASSLKSANAVKCLSIRRVIESKEMSRVAVDEHQPVEETSQFDLAYIGKTLLNLVSVVLPWHTSQSWATAATGDQVPEIDAEYNCPSGGTYLWLVSNPEHERFPKVGCSLHLGTVPVTREITPEFVIPTGESVIGNFDFESIRTPPRKKGWTIVKNNNIDGWDNGAGGIEVWNSGMFGIKAPSGEYFIELDAYGKGKGKKNQPDVITQQIATEPGRVYLVELKAQARVNKSSDFEILWGGASVSKISPTKGVWNDYSVKVVGTGEPIALSIAEIASQNNGLGTLLDSINVTATSEQR